MHVTIALSRKTYICVKEECQIGVEELGNKMREFYLNCEIAKFIL